MQGMPTYCNFSKVNFTVFKKHYSAFMNTKIPGQMKSLKQMVMCAMGLLLFSTANLSAQDTAVTRTPEEKRELFGYCEKPELIRQLKFSPEIADKIGEIDYWAAGQLLSIEANTNLAFATPNELKEEVIKKYKATRMSGEQLKALLDFKQARATNPAPCAVITLTVNHMFDTLTPQRALQLYKTKHRKPLIDKVGINGRQADMLLEIEVWKQKEALAIAAIPTADFNRIRRTVAMYTERERRCRVVGLPDEQFAAVIQYFNEHQL